MAAGPHVQLCAPAGRNAVPQHPSSRPSWPQSSILLTPLCRPCLMGAGGLSIMNGASAVLVDCTIADCTARQGGGLRAYQANVTLKGSLVQRCNAYYGGAISCTFSNMELLEGSVITECAASMLLYTRAGRGGSGMCSGLGCTCLLFWLLVARPSASACPDSLWCGAIGCNWTYAIRLYVLCCDPQVSLRVASMDDACFDHQLYRLRHRYLGWPKWAYQTELLPGHKQRT